MRKLAQTFSSLKERNKAQHTNACILCITSGLPGNSLYSFYGHIPGGLWWVLVGTFFFQTFFSLYESSLQPLIDPRPRSWARLNHALPRQPSDQSAHFFPFPVYKNPRPSLIVGNPFGLHFLLRRAFFLCLLNFCSNLTLVSAFLNILGSKTKNSTYYLREQKTAILWCIGKTVTEVVNLKSHMEMNMIQNMQRSLNGRLKKEQDKRDKNQKSIYRTNEILAEVCTKLLQTKWVKCLLSIFTRPVQELSCVENLNSVGLNRGHIMRENLRIPTSHPGTSNSSMNYSTKTQPDWIEKNNCRSKKCCC